MKNEMVPRPYHSLTDCCDTGFYQCSRCNNIWQPEEEHRAKITIDDYHLRSCARCGSLRWKWNPPLPKG